MRITTIFGSGLCVKKAITRMPKEQFKLAVTLSHDTVPEAEYNLGVVRMMQKPDKAGLKDAAQYLQRALELDPDYYAANKKLAECYTALGDKQHAAAYRSKADNIHKKFTSSVP